MPKAPTKSAKTPRRALKRNATIEPTAAIPLNSAAILGEPSFFGAHDTAKDPLVAPRVYRVAAGSHLAILAVVGRKRVSFVEMDTSTARGINMRHMDLSKFREDYVSANYDVAQAAAKFLKAEHITVTQTAAVVLKAIEDGADAKAIKEALEKRPDEAAVVESITPASSLAGGLFAAGKQSAADKAAKAAKEKPRGRGIGAWVREQILAATPDDKILKEVQSKFPGAKTNAAHLAWYRNDLRKNGQLKDDRKT